MSTNISSLQVPTNEVKPEVLRAILLNATKQSKSSEPKEVIWTHISKVLWQHLEVGFNSYDDQLLCATCFYTVLTLTDEKHYYLNEVLEIINNELSFRYDYGNLRTETAKAVALMYGMFQSAFLTHLATKDLPNVTCVLNGIFKLLVLMAYEYSKFTFLAFKTIGSFKKVSGTDLQKLIFHKDNQITLINLVNHNWENPITGVRDLNKIIFSTLISIIDQEMYEAILEEINRFYWNKAKYLMLAEIVEHSNNGIVNLLQENNWTDGLINTLYKQGLVSAGADMYYAVLKKIKSEDEWCEIFLDSILKILNGSSYKAIENFNNYWCLNTFKAYPLIVQVLIDSLNKVDDSDHKLYSNIFLIKQANKLGLISKKWMSTDYKHQQIEKIVTNGLQHCNNQVRLLAFDIVCISQNKNMPTKIEYDLILNFLHNNINSDCTVLRISMLNSLKIFLLHLHVLFLNNINQGSNFENMQYFCKKFQELIITSLNFNGNYQRKITCIKLLQTFSSCLSEIPKKRQKQTKQTNISVIEMLKDSRQWIMSDETVISKLISLLNDPADDIRENVTQLLLNHYSVELGQKEKINVLITDALKNMTSKFFYEISCGYSVFKLVNNLLIHENHQDGIFNTIEDIFNYGKNELITEFKLKRGVVKSIETGKQLHSFISILYATLEVCYQNSYRIKINNDSMIELLEVLEGISNQFEWEEENSTSSDFSKISDMVQDLILQSGFNNCAQNDHTKLSGLHQIVLNCLWLNVKGSCDLSSLLIRYQREDAQMDFCEKSLNIITRVLETCRHKGAIEAAGVALGQSIHYLTSLSEELDISNLPFVLLKNKLREMISEASKMASVTRRGAGLSIMVHRIVSNDAKRGKPLFNYFMRTLLETCFNTEDIPTSLYEDKSMDNEKDLPKAIYIHFLTRIVTDSSLASDMMFYSAELAQLAFDNLTSPHWQIRNAALQLYGALIPKLIGQKKASGTNDETIATVACDELRTHSPKLWKFIQNQLKNEHNMISKGDEVQYHSNVIPILNMLANCAKRYNFSFDSKEQMESDNKLLGSLMLLLGSSIYTVRRLTAKCIFNMYSMDMIYKSIIDQHFVSENFLHGCLMLLFHCYKLYCNISIYKEYFVNLKELFTKILNTGYHSYISIELFEKIFQDNSYDAESIMQTLSQVESNVHEPGVFLWAQNRFRNYIFNAPWAMIPQMLKSFLDCNDFEKYCEFLLLKIEKDHHNMTKQVLFDITSILFTFKNKYNSSVTWKIIYKISLHSDYTEKVDTTEIFEYLNEITFPSYKLRYILPYLTRILCKSDNANKLPHISKIINSLSDAQTTDTDMRYIAALANNELGNSLNQLSKDVQIIAISSEFILLQDEDEDIRILSTLFFRNIIDDQVVPHPYICLSRLLDYNFLNTLLSNSGIKELSDNLSKILSAFSSEKKCDKYNPFANDFKNIYLEVEVCKMLINKI